jgi:hypothetical protein
MKTVRHYIPLLFTMIFIYDNFLSMQTIFYVYIWVPFNFKLLIIMAVHTSKYLVGIMYNLNLAVLIVNGIEGQYGGREVPQRNSSNTTIPGHCGRFDHPNPYPDTQTHTYMYINKCCQLFVQVWNTIPYFDGTLNYQYLKTKANVWPKNTMITKSNIHILGGNQNLTIQAIASHFTDWTIPASLIGHTNRWW